MTASQEGQRPDPDALLAAVQRGGDGPARGRLKVFFGFAAGVGKTYAMLSEARAKAQAGVDVVIGYAEPHARPETEALLLGLEILPPRVTEYRGVKLREFDLDAALARRPELIVVDELAHSNVPGSRHARRWQDVEELLAAGLDVVTTLNVQHLESLNDVVAQITGVVVRETLPDAVLERADEVELVDLPPDELLARLSEGKVYVPPQAELAQQGFFRRPNLVALRELALRKTADRVNADVQDARRQQAGRSTWPTAERILVCVGPSPTSARVIRAAKRLAVSLHAEWIAASVEAPGSGTLDPAGQERLLRHFRLAERLGAQTVTLVGENVADELVRYARQRNVTKIMAGKPDRAWWQALRARSLVDQLLRWSGDIDVYVVRGLPGEDGGEARPAPAPHPSRPRWAAYGWAALTVAACSALAALLPLVWRDFDLANLVMVYLAGVVFVAARLGRGPSMLASVLSVAVFDFFFVPPPLTFAVHDTQYVVTFVVMLGVGLVIATLTAQVRERAESARRQARRTEALYRMASDLAATTGPTALAEAAVRHVRDVFVGEVAILLPGPDRQLAVRAASDPSLARDPAAQGVAAWVLAHHQPAGRGTDTLSAAEALYLPLVAAHGAVGVLALRTAQIASLLGPEQRRLLDALLKQIALAVEREQLAQAAQSARVQAESEKLRSALLSSVSHDLRTPLAVITGASSSLLHAPPAPAAARELLETIADESSRLSRLVANLLDITRLESGAVQVTRQWQPLEEVVGSALHHLESSLAGRNVRTDLPRDLPLAPMDGVLIEQVLVNLVENAVKYTAAGSSITVAARAEPGRVVVEVIDDGPGVPAGDVERVFEKFYRGAAGPGQRGAGLGLAICRAIVTAHGGQIAVRNRAAPERGAVFSFWLPLDGVPPPVVAEPPEA